MDVEKAFDEWPHSHQPNEYFIQKRAFEAGWHACMEKFREMDLAMADLEDEVKALRARYGEAD